MGPYRDCLTSDDGHLALDCVVDNAGSGELLEGIGVKDPEYLDWLNDQALLSDTVAPKEQKVLASNSVPRVHSVLDEAERDARFFSSLVADAVIQRVSEAASIETVEGVDAGSNPGRLEIVLRTSAQKRGDQAGVRLRLETAATGAVIWTGHRVIETDVLGAVETVELRRLMNQAVDAAVARYRHLRPSQSVESQSSALCFRAVPKMFSLDKASLEEAEVMLNKASDLDDRGIYSAWRAYLKIIQYGERIIADREATSDEATELIAYALERSTSNSMVLALASYVQSMLFKNYVSGAELAEESLNQSRINPLAWAFLGIAKLHLGQFDEAYRCTTHARKISGHGAFRYQLNMLACQTAVVTGRFDEAIQLAMSTVGLAPSYAPPKRYLAALLMNDDREEEALEVIKDLKQLEPEFSLELLNDDTYPASALRRSPLGDRLGEFAKRTARPGGL